MNKHLLVATLALFSAATPMRAETKYYASDSGDVFGLLNGISDNGNYAVVGDDESNYSYFWNIENPGEFEEVSQDALLYDVADNGLAVGGIFDGKRFRAVTYLDGEWTELPSHLDVLNEQYAICITPDARVISGYEFDYSATSEMGGRYYPVVWTLNEESGEYELTKFNDLQLPDHQGFITECMTTDGKFIGGRLYCAAMSEIPALIDVEKHEIIYWNKLEVRSEPFEYKGEIIGWFDEYYIDGYHDTDSSRTFSGEFISCDVNGNFYGHRTVALSVSEDGQEADLEHYASIYNMHTGEWTDVLGVSAFSVGFDNAKTIFATGAQMVVFDEEGEDTILPITEGLDFTTSDDISAIMKGSADGKVLGGIYGIYNPAKQSPDYHPFMILLDNPLTGISEIAVDRGSDIMILVAEGRIEVANAVSVAVYDAGGRLVSSSSSSTVRPGIYVVKADDVSKKVVVR